MKSEIKSPFHKARKLCAVPVLIKKVSVLSLLINFGLPVTISRAHLWRSVRDLSKPVKNEPEDFHNVTRDGLRILGLTKHEMSVGFLRVTQPILIAAEIAHKFILENDFYTEYKCNILNSQKVFCSEMIAYHTLCSDRPSI